MHNYLQFSKDNLHFQHIDDIYHERNNENMYIEIMEWGVPCVRVKKNTVLFEWKFDFLHTQAEDNRMA